MGASTNQSVVQNKLRALATGIPTVPLADPWVLNGTGYSKAQLVQLLQASITATDAASAAKATAAQAVASAKAQRKQALMLRALVLKLLELQLGDVSPVLTQLGFTTAPRRPLVFSV